MKSLLDELKSICSNEKDETERKILIFYIISKALNEVGIYPILVGGAAVEFYTKGSYSSGDIDIIAPLSKGGFKVMKSLGFKKEGRMWINRELKIFIEFPADNISNNERVDEIRIKGHLLKIISKEDLVIDRICAYKYWTSLEDGKCAYMLLFEYFKKLDFEHLKNRAKQEEVFDVLQKILRWVEKAKIPQEKDFRRFLESCQKSSNSKSGKKK